MEPIYIFTPIITYIERGYSLHRDECCRGRGRPGIGVGGKVLGEWIYIYDEKGVADKTTYCTYFYTP